MERIGVAASKMARGNLWRYNMCVVLISFLFSLFIFFIVGVTVTFSLMGIVYLSSQMNPHGTFTLKFNSAFTVCMVSLTIIIVIFNLLAISKNIKLSRNP